VSLLEGTPIPLVIGSPIISQSGKNTAKYNNKLLGPESKVHVH